MRLVPQSSNGKLLLCYCYFISLLLAYFAIVLLIAIAIRKNVIVNALKDYLKANGIQIKILVPEMGVNRDTVSRAINEKTEFDAKQLKVLLEYGMPFEIIRERMKRLYDEKRIAEKYRNGNAEIEFEIEAEFEADTETWD